ncbi:MAG TPA: dTDP-4-dehydrorhamnose 3,5-epimerase [Dissulfurispiraceae bacterium]|nr:dTDP-4-dehydrorhamnose 3,5-epimerase [Dissulfurispiraceae bacterium]
MSNFEFERLSIPDLVLVKPRVFGDDRGFFLETYKGSDFAGAGISEYFVQDNYSLSVKNVLRGLHYQKDPCAQGKLVRCIRGSVYDVGVDIRKGSPYYGRWVGVELSGENNLMIYVPPGFAHGFLVLSETAEVSYKCTREYSPDHDRGIFWNDPDLSIKWPGGSPILSSKDLRHPKLKDADNNFAYNIAHERGASGDCP